MTSIQWAKLGYQQQLDKKVLQLRELLEPYTRLDAQVVTSPDKHYRMRCEFRVWHENGKAYYAMFEKGTKKAYKVEDFVAACESIYNLMPVLLIQINSNEMLRRRLFGVEFLATTTGQILVTLIYHRPLDDQWRTQGCQLGEKLNIDIIGRSRKQKIVLGRNHVIEELVIDSATFQLMQIENSFTQPNAQVNQLMLAWVLRQLDGLEGDLLELYCGNGNFTLPLSTHFNKVLATEISKTSIAALNWNLEQNKINNISVARMSAQEVIQAIDRVRSFQRLKHVNLDDYDFSTIFVDPPRAGIDEMTMKLLSRFDTVIYVSCNPRSLAENISLMDSSHQITAVAAFDQFPFTPHLEAAVILKSRSKKIS